MASGGYLRIPVLEFLRGRKYDAAARAAITALRPSSVREITDFEKTDARLWRVTVYLHDDGTVIRVCQEVQFSDPTGTYANGFELGRGLGL